MSDERLEEMTRRALNAEDNIESAQDAWRSERRRRREAQKEVKLFKRRLAAAEKVVETVRTVLIKLNGRHGCTAHGSTFFNDFRKEIAQCDIVLLENYDAAQEA